MSFNGCLNPLRFNTDIALSDGCGAVLQQSLDKGNIITVVLIDLGSIPLAETVGTDALIAEVITDQF